MRVELTAGRMMGHGGLEVQTTMESKLCGLRGKYRVGQLRCQEGQPLRDMWWFKYIHCQRGS